MDVRSVSSEFVVLIDLLIYGTPSVFGADAGSESAQVPSHRSPNTIIRKIGDSLFPRETQSRAARSSSNIECYYCHEVRGEDFPAACGGGRPELSQMGPLHPIEFFAESIINPNAVVPKAYQRPDGTSPMTRFHRAR